MLSRIGQAIDFAIGARCLHDHLGLNQSRVAQVFQRRVYLAIACVPVARQSAVKRLLDIVASHGSRPQQAENDVAQAIARGNFIAL